MPSENPDPSLNFEEGEVLYENARLLEWAKFWNYSTIVGYIYIFINLIRFVWAALFVPY